MTKRYARQRLAAWALVGAVCALGCSRRATITRVDGRLVEGVIVGGDAEHIRVDPVSDGPDAGSAYAIEIARDGIEEIAHPGAGDMASGGLLLCLGALVYGVTALSRGVARDEDLTYGLVAGTGLLVGGLGLTARGFEAHAASTRAAMVSPGPAASVPIDGLAARVGLRGVGANTDGESAVGLTAGLTVPLIGRLLVEPGLEVDGWLKSEAVVIRVPVRLGVSMPLFGGGYRLHVMPGLGYAARLPVGEAGGAGPERVQHGFVYELSVSHVLRVVDGVDVELGHGFGWTRFGDPERLGPEGGRLGFEQFEVVAGRLGVRIAL